MSKRDKIGILVTVWAYIYLYRRVSWEMRKNHEDDEKKYRGHCLCNGDSDAIWATDPARCLNSFIFGNHSHILRNTYGRLVKRVCEIPIVEQGVHRNAYIHP